MTYKSLSPRLVQSTIVGPFLEVESEMFKKCTPLWREMLQNDGFWKLRCSKSARRLWRENTFPSQNA